MGYPNENNARENYYLRVGEKTGGIFRVDFYGYYLKSVEVGMKDLDSGK